MDAATEYPVLDGVEGWWVVAGVAFINMTNQSILSVFGLLFGTQLQQIKQETFTAALITNLNSLVQNFTGFFIGPIIENFKARNIASVGCLMVCFGLVICAFASQDWQFIIGYSFMVGLGLGLIAPTTFMTINSYFDAKRGRAVGLSSAGSGLGQVFIPQLVSVFLDNYGFRAAVLAMAFMSLTGIFGALLLKPLPSRNHYQRLVHICDLELLRDPVFISIIIGLALVYTTTVNFMMLFPIFLQTTVGLSSTATATCMSVGAFADIISRLLLPCITDKLQIPYRIIFLIGTFGLLISRTALAESTNIVSITVFTIFAGLFKSATAINNNLTISGHCQTEKLAGSLGINMISRGIFVITVGQLLGWIRDYTGSYILAIHAQSLLLLLVVIVWTPEIYYHFWQQGKRKNLALIDSD